MRNLLLLLCVGFAFHQAKAQDTCATALTITAGEYVVDAVNGSQVPDPICAPNGSGATAGEWYKYTATQDYYVTVTTDLAINLGKDTRVHIYSGDCNNLTCVAGNDDTPNNYLSHVVFPAFQGQTYYIAFDNRWNSSGFTFHLLEQPYVAPPVSFTQNNSLNIPGSYRSCVVDMNGDYLDDIVGVGNGVIYIMYQLEGGGFNTVSIPTDETNHMPSWSIAAGDIDGNGYNDLLYGGGSGVTFKIANSDGTAYSQITSNTYIFSQRTNFVDINNDGKLDAFICHDVQPNVYYLNEGDLNFTFHQGGIGDFPNGGNYGSLWFDYDNDGDLDLFISKCRGGNTGANINELHRNNGDGTFTNVAPDIAMDDPIQTWSSAIGDFDNDGDMDILIGASSTANGNHILKRNNGDGTFTDVTIGSGFDNFNGLGYEYVTHDFNNDGYLDILTSSQVIFLGNGDLTFTPVSAGISGAIGDLNNDGFLDIQRDGTVYFNNGNDNNWVKFSFEGVESNRNGIGARVEIHGDWGMQIREVRSGDGFEYMSSLNAHFGIGQATSISQVVVKWPSGVIDYINNPGINQTIHVVEGASLKTNPVELQTSLKLYPNPTDHILYIDSDMTFTEASIYNINGRLVKEAKVTNQSLSVNELAQGTYILLLKNKDGKYLSNRFIKK